MSTHKFKVTQDRIVRCQALDKCFSDTMRLYFIDDLVSACNKALWQNGYKAVSKRTVQYDIEFMQYNPKWNIEFVENAFDGGHRYYRYKDCNFSIWKNDLSESQVMQLKGILILLNQFKGIPQFERMQELMDDLQEKYGFETNIPDGVVSFDANQYVCGIEHLSELFNAIVNRQTIQLKYKPYSCEQHQEVIISPYFIKQYNGRWFLVAQNPKYVNPSNFALDRICSIEIVTDDYIPCNVNIEEYFDDIIGVTFSSDDVKRIKLQFSKHRFPYVLTKPLHPSQRVVNKEECTITIDVKPNNELYQNLLSFGADVVVLEPAQMRDTMKNLITLSYNLYK